MFGFGSKKRPIIPPAKPQKTTPRKTTQKPKRGNKPGS
jgi:hypothetical protein